MLRKLTILLSIWPSWRFLDGIAGAVPIGSVLAALQIRRLKVGDVAFLLSFAVLLVVHTSGAADALEVAKLLVGPVLLIYFRRVALDGLGRSLAALITLFLLEAVAGRFVSDDLRSATFLTLEPSHSARAFYGYLLLHFLLFRRHAWTVALALVFVAFNTSLSAVIFSLVLVTLVAVRRLGVLHVLRLGVAATATLAAIGLYTAAFPETRVAESLVRLERSAVLLSQGQDVSNVLNTAGGPRIALATAAFFTSSPWGYGLGYGQQIRSHVQGTPFDFANVPYILQRPSAEPASYLSQIAFEIGWVGVAVLLAWLLAQLRRGWRPGLLWAFGLLQLALYSTTTMPTPWVFLGLAQRRELFPPPAPRTRTDPGSSAGPPVAGDGAPSDPASA